MAEFRTCMGGGRDMDEYGYFLQEARSEEALREDRRDGLREDLRVTYHEVLWRTLPRDVKGTKTPSDLQPGDGMRIPKKGVPSFRVRRINATPYQRDRGMVGWHQVGAVKDEASRGKLETHWDQDWRRQYGKWWLVHLQLAVAPPKDMHAYLTGQYEDLRDRVNVYQIAPVDVPAERIPAGTGVPNVAWLEVA